AVSVVFFQAEDGVRVFHVTGVQTCALPISGSAVVPLPVCKDTVGTPSASTSVRWDGCPVRRGPRGCAERYAACDLHVDVDFLTEPGEDPTTREGPSGRGDPAARARPPPTRPDVRLPETVYSLRVDVDRVKVREAYSGHGVKKL